MRIISGIARGTNLHTLEGLETRPTLDRVKESVFNIIQNEIQDSVFLDLFSGCGAVGLEAVSRGAKKSILCDKSADAIQIIKKNISKTHFEEKVEVYNIDFSKCLKSIKDKLDIIYIDPPYKSDYVEKSLEILQESGLCNKDTIIIIETDEKDRIKNEIAKLKYNIVDERQYGRASLIFLNIE